jgi:hypothetical protein
VSPRASGEGARIELNSSALTRAGGASSPEGRGKRKDADLTQREKLGRSAEAAGVADSGRHPDAVEVIE